MWWNYDANSTAFDPNSDFGNASLHADWPLTQFFWHNAGYYNVTSKLCDSSHSFTDYCQGGGNGHHLRANDGSGWFWADPYGGGGNKNGNPCNAWDIHYVPYSGRSLYGSAFYNTSWGFWMPTSTHYDYNDGSGCSGYTTFGYSDQAERNLENAELQAGMQPYQPGQSWYNYEPYRVEYHVHADGHYEYHIWENYNYTVPVYVDF